MPSTLPMFPTQEIGSMGKPNWLVKKIRGRPIAPEDYAELEKWEKLAGLDDAKKARARELLGKAELDGKEKEELHDYAGILLLRMFDAAGLDIVYDGEQHRSEMYQEPVELTDGFRFYGNVRSFDNKYYKKAACCEEPKIKKEFHVDEYKFVRRNTERQVKVPITGAYTLADWSFNEYYLKKWRAQEKDVRKANHGAQMEFAVEIARKMIRPNIKALLDAGAEVVQIDEPAVTTHPDEIDVFVQSFNESVKGLQGKFTLHICFSDYTTLYPQILELENCAQYTFEFANQEGYSFLELMKEHKDEAEVGLGVLDVHVDKMESAEFVRDKVLAAAKILGPEKVYVNPDCGLRTRSWQVSYDKLSNMVKGTEMARKEFE